MSMGIYKPIYLKCSKMWHVLLFECCTALIPGLNPHLRAAVLRTVFSLVGPYDIVSRNPCRRTVSASFLIRLGGTEGFWATLAISLSVAGRWNVAHEHSENDICDPVMNFYFSVRMFLHLVVIATWMKRAYKLKSFSDRGWLLDWGWTSEC